MKVMISADYRTFLAEIKERIHKAQYDAFKAVNKELIRLYWDIGKSIVAKQEKLGWGKAIVETLAKDLQKEFPGIQGFSIANLWRMRNLYVTYHKNEKLAPVVREISWTKNIIQEFFIDLLLYHRQLRCLIANASAIKRNGLCPLLP